MEVIEIVRLLDKDDNENKIFPIPSSARVNQRHFGGKM